MSDNEANNATQEVNERLAALRSQTAYAKILELRKLVKTAHNPALERAASRMLKYYERVYHDEKFAIFLKKKAKLLKKKLHELTPEERRNIRSDFNRMN